MKFVAGMIIMCTLCLSPLQQVQAQQSACRGKDRCLADASMVLTAWAPIHGLQRSGQSRTATEPANLDAAVRCQKAPVDVTGASLDEHSLVCTAASDALHLLSRCNITPRRPLNVQIANEVRQPFSGLVFGLLNTKIGKIFVTRQANVAPLIRGTPYDAMPMRVFYKSLIVHEIIHGVMHQNFVHQPTSRAAHEYPAYALQIALLPPGERAKFLSSVDKEVTSKFHLNDLILAFNPFLFAARAYRHFEAAPDGCAHLLALLAGDAAFIPIVPSL